MRCMGTTTLSYFRAHNQEWGFGKQKVPRASELNIVFLYSEAFSRMEIKKDMDSPARN